MIRTSLQQLVDQQQARVVRIPQQPHQVWVVQIAADLPKIPSKIAKFHLQIVENRLKFQSKNLPPLDPTGPDELNRINVELMSN